MSVKQQSVMRQGGEGDASCNTSRWSSPSSMCCGSDCDFSTDFDDKVDSLLLKTSEIKSSKKCQGPKTFERNDGKKHQLPHRQKTNASSLQVLKLPHIQALQVSRIQSDNLNCVMELKSQVWDLQQQLREARTENKLLKRLQHRHMMALQHFQDSEGSLSQILTNHANEARVLRGQLCETRTQRHNLMRQLRASENKLLSAKDSLQHLQQLGQDHSLLKREELTLRLTKAAAELQEKDKRVKDLEKNLELCQASFKRQMVTEQRKIQEARKLSCYLQDRVYQLSTEIQDLQRKVEANNIYSHRMTKKGRESKMVQTDGFLPVPTMVGSVLELEYTEELCELDTSSNNSVVSV